MPIRSASGQFAAGLTPSANNIRAMLRQVRAPGWSKPCLVPPRLNDKGRRWRINNVQGMIYPHRVLWVEKNGELAKAAMLFRKCDTIGCCEPSHHDISIREAFDDDLTRALS